MSPRSPIGKFGAPSLYRVRGLGLGSRDPAVHVSIKSTFFQVEKRWRYWEAMVETFYPNLWCGKHIFEHFIMRKTGFQCRLGRIFRINHHLGWGPFLEVWAYASHNSPMNLCNIFTTLISFNAENENPDLFDVTKDDLNHPIKLKLLLTSKSLFSSENSSSKSDVPFQMQRLSNYPTRRFSGVLSLLPHLSISFTPPISPQKIPRWNRSKYGPALFDLHGSAERLPFLSPGVDSESLSPDWGWVEV